MCMKFRLHKHARIIISTEIFVYLQTLILDGNREIRQVVQWGKKVQVPRD